MNREMPKTQTLRKGFKSAWPIVVLIVITTGLFFVDLSLPLGVAAGVPYLLCILWASRIGTRQVWMTAIATSLLVMLGYALSPDGGEDWKIFLNRGVALMAIWVTAMNCVRWLQAESSLIHLNNQLEQTVFERTQRLAMQSSVANVLRGSDKWDTALPNTLNVICQEMKWQVGIYWKVDPTTHIATCTSTVENPGGSYTAFIEATQHSQVIPKMGLSGRAWECGMPCWISNITQDMNGSRKTAAQEAQLQGGLAFPVMLDQTAIGIMEFFSCHLPSDDQDLLDTFQSISIHISQFLKRESAENQALASRQNLESTNAKLVLARDQALNSAKAKANFLASMSHEIRTPLNGVIGMTDLLLSTGLDADQQEMVETVKHSGEFLLTIINDILDFSKIDAGKLDLEVIDFDIRTAVDEVLDILAERASQKNLELIGLIYATTPLQLRGDPGRIRQILFNLIGNAIKFTQEGEIVVVVSVIETATNERTLRFAVTDTGIGIAPEAQRTLFEPFTQADSSTTRKFGGTGLGLTICKKLVTLMQGEIGVISEKGQGSTFWFTIPFAHGSKSSPPVFPNATLQGRRVCIVESNDTIRFLLQHYAQSWGMICDVAQNGSEGLALLQQHAKGEQSFDIALLDHTLSETIQEDGLSLAKRIRQDSGISHIPLILLTALGKRGEGKLAQHAGFNGYLTKPIRHQQLQRCLQMILGSDQRIAPAATSHSSTLITRHTVEEAQAQTQAHILLAEDNVVNQKVAVRMLQKIGYRVDVVENGQEAVEAVGRTSYDLVLMDCQMPEMDGLEATRAIRKAESKKLEVRSKEVETDNPETPDSLLLTTHCSRVPIVALTANALSGDREICLEAGMDDFLTKPIRMEELETMICKWLPHPGASTLENQPITEKIRKDSTTLPPCLDDTTLENLKILGGEDNPEFFLTVIEQFLLDLPRHLEGIKQAVERQDSEALVKTAHACKGSSRTIGATLLAEISYALELSGREGTMTDATAKFEQWLQAQERTTHALQQERKQLTSSSLSTPPS